MEIGRSLGLVGKLASPNQQVSGQPETVLGNKVKDTLDKHEHTHALTHSHPQAHTHTALLNTEVSWREHLGGGSTLLFAGPGGPRTACSHERREMSRGRSLGTRVLTLSRMWLPWVMTGGLAGSLSSFK